MDIRTVRASKEICKECNGNGYTRVPYHLAKEEIWADCDTCDSQGEIKIIKEEIVNGRQD
jgi:DnaJ-class molecular chaperone|tara:strand:+ start:25 stop:204 length:180 start_codon:yes stop_codon:yes gene_type:complete